MSKNGISEKQTEKEIGKKTEKGHFCTHTRTVSGFHAATFEASSSDISHFSIVFDLVISSIFTRAVSFSTVCQCS